MIELQRLMQAIEDEESYRAEPYRDSLSLWTVGIGLCIERTPITPNQWQVLLDKGLATMSVTKEGARLLARAKVEQIEMDLERLVRKWHSISEPRQHVLISMAYQMGIGFIYKFPKFMLAVEAGNWKEAAKEGLDSKWARTDSPARAKRLMLKLERGEF